MFVIFDLDDTLVNTAETIGRHQFEQVAKLWQSLGVDLEIVATVEGLTRLRKELGTGKAAIRRWVQQQGWDDSFTGLAIEEYYHRQDPRISLDFCVGAEEVLRTLHGHVPLALITIGRREQQMGKMERVGLRSDFFDYVEIVDADKEPAYRRVLEAWGLALDVPHPEVVVVGDRESTDLDPARPLGLRLVLVGERGPRQPVDAWIKTLRELPELLAVWDSQDRIPSRGIPKPL